MSAIHSVIQSAVMENEKGFRLMTQAVGEKIASELLEATATQCYIQFNGTGLLADELPFYKHLTEYTAKCNSHRVQVLYGLRMKVEHINLDQAWFLSENGFSVTLVNPCRPGWEKDFLAAFSPLQEAGILVTVETPITKNTVDHIDDIFDYYCKNRVFYQSYGLEGYPQQSKVTPTQYADFIKKLFDLWYGELVERRYYSIRYFDDLLRMSNGEYPQSCMLLGCCDLRYFFNVDGLVYPCDYMMNDDSCLGSIEKTSLALIDMRREKCRWQDGRATVPPQCRSCQWRNLCNNGCYCQRLPAESDVYLNAYCDSYKNFFSYAVPKFNEIKKILYNIAASEQCMTM